jgi:hypothetical protein
MPPTSSQSPLAARLGAKARTAFDAHKNDEVEIYDFGDLPPNIEGGVARLAGLGFAEIKSGDNKGKMGFSGFGIVEEPENAATYAPDKNGKMAPSGFTRVRGRRTRLTTEPLCDTPGKSRSTLDEHVKWVQNEIKKLWPGVDPESLTLDNIEETCRQLVEAAPYFRFSTSAGKVTPQNPTPRVFHNWNGVEPDYVPPDPNASVDDATAASPTPAPRAAASAPRGQAVNGPARTSAGTPRQQFDRAANGPPAARPTSRGGASASPSSGTSRRSSPPPAPANDEDDRLDDLVAAADDEADPAAQAEAQVDLEAAAAEAGLTPKQVKAAPTWADLVVLIREARDGGGEEPAEGEAAAADGDEGGGDAPEEYTPVKGDAVSYRPLDPKTRRRAAKPVDCQVLALNARAQTATLKDLDSGKQYKDVAWADLEAT